MDIKGFKKKSVFSMCTVKKLSLFTHLWNIVKAISLLFMVYSIIPKHT